jgi:predicted transposase YdaD
MFQLTELSKTRAGQEIREEGRQEGRQEAEFNTKQKIIRHCLSTGLSVKETAKVTCVPLAEVRRLAKDAG